MGGGLAQFSALVEEVYSAPFASDGWHTVPARLAEVLDSQWSQMYVTDFSGPGESLSLLEPFHPDALEQYVNHYMSVDPRAWVVSRRDSTPRTRDVIVSDDVFRRSEIFNDFLNYYHAEQSLVVPIQGSQAV